MAVQVGDREMAEDSQVGEDKVMAVQVGDREMAAMPEDREIAED